jgi:hypothetical protein
MVNPGSTSRCLGDLRHVTTPPWASLLSSIKWIWWCLSPRIAVRLEGDSPYMASVTKLCWCIARMLRPIVMVASQRIHGLHGEGPGSCTVEDLKWNSWQSSLYSLGMGKQEKPQDPWQPPEAQGFTEHNLSNPHTGLLRSWANLDSS